MLDLFVFDDPAARQLRAGLGRGAWRWLATTPMRDELERVLSYSQIAPRLGLCGLQAHDVMASFDRHAVLVDPPPKATLTCSDRDDQKFIDLAVEYRCLLLTKDRAVLCLKNRLAALGVCALTAIPDSSYRRIDS